MNPVKIHLPVKKGKVVSHEKLTPGKKAWITRRANIEKLGIKVERKTEERSELLEHKSSISKVLLGKEYNEYNIIGPPIKGLNISNITIYASNEDDVNKFRNKMKGLLGIKRSTSDYPEPEIKEFISTPDPYKMQTKFEYKPEQKKEEQDLHLEVLKSITENVPKCNDFSNRQIYVKAKAELYMRKDKNLAYRDAINKAFDYFSKNCK